MGGYKCVTRNNTQQGSTPFSILCNDAFASARWLVFFFKTDVDQTIFNLIRMKSLVLVILTVTMLLISVRRFTNGDEGSEDGNIMAERGILSSEYQASMYLMNLMNILMN